MQPPFLFPTPEVSIGAILPILVVALTGILALIVELVWPKRNNDLIVGISLGGLALSALLALNSTNVQAYDTMAGAYRHDMLGAISQVILAVGTFLTILFSESYLRAKRIPFAEFYPLVLWSTAGAMIMVSTQNLLVIFLGLEILSVALYVMAGMSRGESGSSESALKYFLLGAFASGFLLYGIAFLYGASGSLNLPDIGLAWANRGPANQPMILFGLALLLIGAGFKASLVPFHQWTPDVYQGAPTNVTAYMATGSKVAAFITLVRVLDVFTQLYPVWLPVLSLIAVLTMTIGNVMALTQKDVKRTLGYSSIAQAGYVLVAILAHAIKPDKIGTGTITFFLFAYVVTTVGAFAVVSLTAQDGREGTRLEDLNGMIRRAPLAAVALLVFCMSLIGLPLTGGFMGKLQIFTDAMDAGLNWLAIALAVNSVISAWYYLGIARAALTSDGVPDPERRISSLRPAVASACVLCLAGVLASFFLPSLLSFFGQK
ncbi:MAG: NADH-quinone oxidoreductase subunit N [Fimbriimonas sp.]